MSDRTEKLNMLVGRCIECGEELTVEEFERGFGTCFKCDETEEIPQKPFHN